MKSLIALPIVAAAAVPATAQQAAPVVLLYPMRGPTNPEIIRPVTPVGKVATWVSAADYPPRALSMGYPGDVIVTVQVNADGSIAACAAESLVGSVDMAFGQKACEVIRARGHFLYAIDADGKARGGTIRMLMHFAVPRNGSSGALPPAPPAPGAFNSPPRLLDPTMLNLPANPKLYVNREPAVRVDIDATGHVTRCHVYSTAGTDAGDVEICKRMIDARFEPSRTSAGVSVPQEGFLVQLKVGN